MMLMLTIPAAVGLIVLASPIVALIFERGSFSSSDTAATATALAFYAPGLIGYSAVRIAVPCFYALKDSVTPAVISVASVALNIVLNVILVRQMGYRGLALGTSIAALFNAGVLLYLIRGRIGGLDTPRLLVAFVKIAIVAVVMGIATVGVHTWLLRVWPGPDLLVQLVRVGLSISSWLVVPTSFGSTSGIRPSNGCSSSLNVSDHDERRGPCGTMP